jgi:ankyrin repeat protein
LIPTFSSLYPFTTMAVHDPLHEQLFDAIMRGDDATALSIVRGGVDVNGELDSWTHLYAASNYNRVAVVSCLLALGADANKVSTLFSATPLSIASRNGNQEVVKLLAEAGNTQINKQDFISSS